MYCGNNALHEGLINGQQVLGTRHKCLRKGIGTGLHLPVDLSYNGPYQPIDTTRSYCGDKPNLPNDYDRFGMLSECLQKGVGIGKRKRAEEGDGGVFMDKQNTIVWVLIILNIIVTVIFIIYVKIYYKKKKQDKLSTSIYRGSLIIILIILAIAILNY